MGKFAEPNIEYAEKFLNEWQLNGGLIRQSEAARMLNVTDALINNLAKRKKLYKTKIDGFAYIGYSDLYSVYKERCKKAQ